MKSLAESISEKTGFGPRMQLDSVSLHSLEPSSCAWVKVSPNHPGIPNCYQAENPGVRESRAGRGFGHMWRILAATHPKQAR